MIVYRSAARLTAKDNARAAQKFLDAVEMTLRLLERRPMIGVAFATGIEELQGLRELRVTGYPKYRIFYRPIAEGTLFVDLLHAARDAATAIHG